MKIGWGMHAGLALAIAILPNVFAGPSRAADAQKMWLACQNGRNYPIHATAVSPDGDIATGYMLQTGAGHAIRLRLVPMGNGYRYEGGGMWFDGVRGDAVLNWGRADEVPCTVMQQ